MIFSAHLPLGSDITENLAEKYLKYDKMYGIEVTQTVENFLVKYQTQLKMFIFFLMQTNFLTITR